MPIKSPRSAIIFLLRYFAINPFFRSKFPRCSRRYQQSRPIHFWSVRREIRHAHPDRSFGFETYGKTQRPRSPHSPQCDGRPKNARLEGRPRHPGNLSAHRRRRPLRAPRSGANPRSAAPHAGRRLIAFLPVLPQKTDSAIREYTNRRSVSLQHLSSYRYALGMNQSPPCILMLLAKRPLAWLVTRDQGCRSLGKEYDKSFTA